jgi:hypothetical protein
MTDKRTRYLLIIRRGPQQGRGFPLEGALATVGRYAGNTVIISDETVSRHHARLRQTDDGYIIEDLKSANGLFVNGERVTEPRPLKDGDVIRLGEVVEIVYEAVTAAEAEAELSAVVPAFDGRPGPTRPVSDIGGTVWMRKVEAPIGRAEPKAPTSNRGWLWIAILVGVIVIGAVIYFAAFAGH